uniref:Uncharacterized protein n=1 Tax=Heterorhabditis bacteriophora TaxID=37862 RepID=A0A1I7X3B2_HETBA
MAPRCQVRWGRFLGTERNRSYAPVPTSYDLHHKAITGLVGGIEKP